MSLCHCNVFFNKILGLIKTKSHGYEEYICNKFQIKY